MTTAPESPGPESPLAKYPAAASLLERAKAIIMKPDAEWPVIAAEPDTPKAVFLRYAVPLAAIGPVCHFIGGQLFGITWRPGFFAALTSGVVQYVLGLVGIFVLALIADTLAPKFGGQSNRTAAFKLVVYGSTAAWAAGIFGLIPGLAVLGLAGLYSFYLYYAGATPVMQVPRDKALGYTAVTIVCAIALYLVVGAIGASFLRVTGGAPGMMMGDSTVSGKLDLPGGAVLDPAKIKQATEQMEAGVSGKTPAIAADKLQALLPGSIGSYQRTATEANAIGGMGSSAEGTYTAGGNSFQLKIADLNALGALAGIGSAMGVSQSRQDADGYEKTGTVDGHMQSEKWRSGAHSGKFSIMVGNRFLIEADGSAASIDELKAAVAAVDQSALASLIS